MKLYRIIEFGTCAAVAAILCACSGGASMPSPSAPLAAAGESPATATKGLYVTVGTSAESIIGYNRKYKEVCREDVPYAGGVSADRAGDLIATDGASSTIVVYQGPQLCGSEYGSVSDPYGQPAATSSLDAIHGTIVVGNVFDNGGAPGSILVCTLAGGCTNNLLDANIYEVGGVALARNGDCWADATNSFGTATLTYFRGCTGLGKSATGFVNEYYGSMQIDRNGNLVTSDAFNARIDVYKGCDPRCKLIGGPFALHGNSFYISLNAKATLLAAADYANSSIDVYRYSPTGLAYRFSFQPGSPSDFLNGLAYSPGR